MHVAYYLFNLSKFKAMRITLTEFLLAGISFLSPLSVYAFDPGPVPDGTGRPGGTTDAGSRDDCPLVELPLRSLIPNTQNTGKYTTLDQPTVWVYMPYTLNIENPGTGFPNLAVLRVETLSYEEVYRAPITVPVETPGILGIPLPDEAPELEIGETYEWYIQIFCNTTETRGRAATASGQIQRVELGAFAPEELWYDRLTEAGTRLQANPEDSEARSHWNELLESADLEHLEDVPIIP